MFFRSLILLLTMATLVRATTVEPPTFPELVAEADSIHRGTVATVQARRVAGPDGSATIKTFVTFVVERTLKGPRQEQVTLEFLGGTVGDDTLEVGGMPRFSPGQREILFVQNNGTQFCPLVRLMHGRYRVETEAGTGREYVARDNRAPLNAVAEVARPLTEGAANAGSQVDTTRALSVAAFEASIARELSQPALQERAR